MENKFCKKCLTEKQVSEFCKDKYRKDGYHPYCKKCKTLEGRDRERQRAKQKYELMLDKQKRVCYKCKEEKPFYDFDDKNFKRALGYVICKCCQEQTKERKRLNRPKYIRLPRLGAENKKTDKETDKEAHREIWRKRYYKTKDRAAIYRNENKQMLAEMLGGKCLRCGLVVSEEYPVVCFDFHHRDNKTKERNISHMLASPKKNLNKLIEEVKKCDLLCSICHRIIHFKPWQPMTPIITTK